jgi:hypothetical protein
MVATLLTILLGLTPWHGDVEEPEEREARLHVIAEAIASAAAGDRTVALLLVVQGEAESHFARHIHEGHCRPWECDRGRSVSPWQIQHGSWLPREEWEAMRGADLEATARAATYAARTLRYGMRACRLRMPSPLHGAFSVAARGGCGWPGAERRVARFHRLGRLWDTAVRAAQEPPAEVTVRPPVRADQAVLASEARPGSLASNRGSPCGSVPAAGYAPRAVSSRMVCHEAQPAGRSVAARSRL